MKKELKNQLITGLLSSPIIYIPHFHQFFIDEVLCEIISDFGKLLPVSKENIVDFDIKRGIIDFDTKYPKKGLEELADFEVLLQKIVQYDDKFDIEKIFLFKNIEEALNKKTVQSLLCSFVYQYEKGAYDQLTTIIIISAQPFSTLPKELANFVTVIEIGIPNINEIREYIEKIPVTNVCNSQPKAEILKNEICRNLQGLQYYDVKQILSSALVRTGGKLSDKTKELILSEKKRVVKRLGTVEVIDSDVRFSDIGGLDQLRADLERKAVIYNHLQEAIDNNITIPKGILIIGMPGCGKSMIAKAVAEKFGVTLLRLDISRLMGKYVGQSEENLRQALAIAEAAHPCVLWIDEIEKSFTGSSGKGDEDKLVMRLMAHFLTWMQERNTPVYIVATANDVMRPEFMRKGRFDEVYFVNFPTQSERKEIFEKKLMKYKNNKIFDLSELTDTMEIVKAMKGKYGGFSGAEIESVTNAVFEQKFVEYIYGIEKHSMYRNDEPSPIKVYPEDFAKKIEAIKHSVMAEQQSKTVKESDKQLILDKQYRDKTNIERIRDMQRTYRFTVATEGNDVVDEKD